MKARETERLAAIPPKQRERQQYLKGYNAARYKYHYRSFLRQLYAALVSASSASKGRSSDR